VILSDDSVFAVERAAWVPVGPTGAYDSPGVFWQTMAHTIVPRLGLVITAGASAIFTVESIAPGDIGFLSYGAALRAISQDGLDIRVCFRRGDWRLPVFSGMLERFDVNSPWYLASFDLASCVGSGGELIVECGPGANNDPTADWLALYELVVAPRSALSLYRARAFRAWRTQNEISVLNQAYRHGMYAPDSQRGVKRPVPPHAFDYATSILKESLGELPTFRSLLLRKMAMQKTRPLRMLSIACGSARVESGMLAGLPAGSVELTLVDINQELLDLARAGFEVPVETVAGDLNEMELGYDRFDVVVCVSALHHVVELERLLRGIADALRPTGEFWNIGEYVGETGARLWPECYRVANELFSSWPEKYRWNHTATAEPRLDASLPNVDCSVVSFEGVRSNEIEQLMASVFKTEWADKRSCFVWRLFDTAYGSNFDTSCAADRAMIEAAALADLSLMERGGRTVELNGVFRPLLFDTAYGSNFDTSCAADRR
jgi:SAM-dependent methyltransferase